MNLVLISLKLEINSVKNKTQELIVKFAKINIEHQKKKKQ
jgi:hypothetical protein